MMDAWSNYQLFVVDEVQDYLKIINFELDSVSIGESAQDGEYIIWIFCK